MRKEITIAELYVRIRLQGRIKHLIINISISLLKNGWHGAAIIYNLVSPYSF